VESIAKRRRLSDNRALASLIEEGIAVAKQREKEFLRLAERFRAAQDPDEIKRLGNEMGRFVFGEYCRRSRLGPSCPPQFGRTLWNACANAASAWKI
jgi:hypothetical protein